MKLHTWILTTALLGSSAAFARGADTQGADPFTAAQSPAETTVPGTSSGAEQTLSAGSELMAFLSTATAPVPADVVPVADTAADTAADPALGADVVLDDDTVSDANAAITSLLQPVQAAPRSQVTPLTEAGHRAALMSAAAVRSATVRPAAVRTAAVVRTATVVRTAAAPSRLNTRTAAMVRSAQVRPAAPVVTPRQTTSPSDLIAQSAPATRPVLKLVAAPVVAPAQVVAPVPVAAPAPVKATVTVTDVPADHWARDAVALLIRQGILLGYPDSTFRGNQGITRYEAATIFARLLDSGALQKAGLSPADMTVLARGVASVADEIVAIGGRVGTLEAHDASREARLSRMEMQVTQMATLLANALPETQNAAGRLSAVEGAVTALPGVLSGKAAAADVALLNTQNAALSAQVAQLSARQLAADARIAAFEAAQAIKATFPPVLPEPRPNPPAPKRLSVGVSAEGGGAGGFGASVDVAAANLLGPVGVRAAAFAKPSASAYGIDLALTANFSAAGLLPYAGLGAGMVFSPNRDTAAGGSAPDVFAQAIVGLNYPVNDSMTLFGEGEGRYYLSNKGTGTGLAAPTGTSTGGGVGLSFRIGARFNF